VPRHRAPRHRVRGFVILIGSLVGMFIALIVGSAVALAGLAGGLVGLIVVLIYLLSVMVFFWELVVRADSLQVDVPQARREPGNEWLTPDDWVAEHIHRSDRNRGVNVVETETIPMRIVPSRPG
jgi:hypothetical protein